MNWTCYTNLAPLLSWHSKKSKIFSNQNFISSDILGRIHELISGIHSRQQGKQFSSSISFSFEVTWFFIHCMSSEMPVTPFSLIILNCSNTKFRISILYFDITIKECYCFIDLVRMNVTVKTVVMDFIIKFRPM